MEFDVIIRRMCRGRMVVCPNDDCQQGERQIESALDESSHGRLPGRRRTQSDRQPCQTASNEHYYSSPNNHHHHQST